jgi:hypothetical protein
MRSRKRNVVAFHNNTSRTLERKVVSGRLYVIPQRPRLCSASRHGAGPESGTQPGVPDQYPPDRKRI